jgi:hypothetical protein
MSVPSIFSSTNSPSNNGRIVDVPLVTMGGRARLKQEGQLNIPGAYHRQQPSVIRIGRYCLRRRSGLGAQQDHRDDGKCRPRSGTCSMHDAGMIAEG